MGYNLSAAQFFAKRAETRKELGLQARPVKKQRPQRPQRQEDASAFLRFMLLMDPGRKYGGSFFTAAAKLAAEHGTIGELSALFGEAAATMENLSITEQPIAKLALFEIQNSNLFPSLRGGSTPSTLEQKVALPQLEQTVSGEIKVVFPSMAPFPSLLVARPEPSKE